MEWSLEYGHAHIKIQCDLDLYSESLETLLKKYDEIIDYINTDPIFETSYEPVLISDNAPKIIKTMDYASRICNVGPMAAVAGTVAQAIGEELEKEGAKEVTVENGGDIYVKTDTETSIGLFSGQSEIAKKIAFKLKRVDTPLGICTSSATVGHSISLGIADSVTCFAKSAACADACATAFANEMRSVKDIEKILEYVDSIKEIEGIVVVLDNNFGAKGNIPEIIGLKGLKTSKTN